MAFETKSILEILFETFLISQFMKAALFCEDTLPKLTIGCTTSHSTEQIGVNFDNFFDFLWGNVTAGGGTGIGRDNDATFELERKTRCTVVELDLSWEKKSYFSLLF